MIASSYINAYIIWVYDAIISYFVLAKCNKKYRAITPYILIITLFYKGL